MIGCGSSTRAELRRPFLDSQGVATRPMLPLFRWTGRLDGRPQGYSLLFTTHIHGKHTSAGMPAGFGQGSSTYT